MGATTSTREEEFRRDARFEFEEALTDLIEQVRQGFDGSDMEKIEIHIAPAAIARLREPKDKDA